MKNFNKTLVTFGLLVIIAPLYSKAESVASSTPESVIASSTEMIATFTSCSQEAIEKRDTSLAFARTDYNNAMNEALLARKEAEKKNVAIINEKEKKEAIKESAENYKNSAKEAQNTLTQSRKSIWQTFDTDIKNCREEFAETKQEEKDIKKETKEEQKHFTTTLLDSIKSLFSSKE
jgi:DNA repair ATPase RecN